jgi:hypothetical protein
MNTLVLLTSAPWATILSTTYGTVEPCSISIQPFESLTYGIGVPEPIPMTYIPDSQFTPDCRRKVKLTVWWGEMCLSTAAQAARCFEASISVVTTNLGGISSGAGSPDPAGQYSCCDQEGRRESLPGVCFTLSKTGELLSPWGIKATGGHG